MKLDAELKSVLFLLVNQNKLSNVDLSLKKSVIRTTFVYYPPSITFISTQAKLFMYFWIKFEIIIFGGFLKVCPLRKKLDF